MIDSMSNILNKIAHADFNFFSDFQFWVFLVAVILIVRLVPVRGAGKDLLLIAANAMMLLALPRFDLVALGIYVTLALFTFAIGSTLISKKDLAPGSRKLLATVGIIAVVAVLAVFKYRLLQQTILGNASLFGRAPGDFIFLIGISYSSFKAIHFIIESFKGAVSNVRFLTFLNYLLFFPSFVSGPINPYNDFCETSASARSARFREDFLPGFERIVHGLFKKFVITVLLFPHTLVQTKVPVADMAMWQILLGLYVYALYFYFDFSGYTDLAIGSARLLGFKLPENFNYPFLKKNIQQLWANWHMSLTSWLTDYVYWPIVRKLRANEVIRKYPLVISNTAIITTFFLCGAWHGESINFILWGLYHGIGMAVVNIYQKYKRQFRHPLALKYFSSPLSYCVGVFLSFNFFAAGLLFLLTPEQRDNVLGRIF
jgi:alginate O-acetyltransferase complex protein AlgI